MALVELPGTTNATDFLFGHLHPLRDPSNCPRHCKENCEHADGDPDCTKDNSRVEIEIGVEMSLNEIRIFQRNFF